MVNNYFFRNKIELVNILLLEAIIIYYLYFNQTKLFMILK